MIIKIIELHIYHSIFIISVTIILFEYNTFYVN